MTLPLRRLLALTPLLLPGFLGAQSTEIRGYAPVSISAANYAETDRDTLLRSVEGRGEHNPDAPAQPVGEPVAFVFVRGEVFSTTPTYEEICRALTPALAQRGFINAADDNDIIRDPGAVKLVLRLS